MKTKLSEEHPDTINSLEKERKRKLRELKWKIKESSRKSLLKRQLMERHRARWKENERPELKRENAQMNLLKDAPSSS